MRERVREIYRILGKKKNDRGSISLKAENLAKEGSGPDQEKEGGDYDGSEDSTFKPDRIPRDARNRSFQTPMKTVRVHYTPHPTPTAQGSGGGVLRSVREEEAEDYFPLGRATKFKNGIF